MSLSSFWTRIRRTFRPLPLEEHPLPQPKTQFRHPVLRRSRPVLGKDTEEPIWEEWFDDLSPDVRDMDSPLTVPYTSLPGGPVIKRTAEGAYVIINEDQT